MTEGSSFRLLIYKYMSISRILVLCLIFCGCLHAAAQNDDIAERCGHLAARGDVAMLREIYDAQRDSLPKNTELYCRFAFARGRGDNRAISAYVDTLEAQYVDDLDLRGLLALCDVKCEALRQLGEYGELGKYCRSRLDWCAKRSIKASRQVNLKYYLQLAERFASVDPVSEEWGSERFFVPISRDWPLLVPVSIDGTPELPFLVSTAQQMSFVSAADAQECGIVVEGAPVTINFRKTAVTATPVVVNDFRVGQLTLHNVMLYVVDDNIPAPYNRSIGNDLLRHFRQIEINDQQMMVRRVESAVAQLPGVPMCFTVRGGLDLQQPVDSGYVRYSLDVSERFDAEDEGNRVMSTDYLKRAHSLVFDFASMTYVASLPRDYAPRPVSDYLDKEDYFDLLRNEASLYFVATDAELADIDMTLIRALTPPDPSTLPAQLRAACITPEQAATLQTTPRQLLVTSKGLILEKAEGKYLKTVRLTPSNIGRHKIDLTNLKIY